MAQSTQEQTQETRLMPCTAGVKQRSIIPPVSELELANILPVNPRLFSENRWPICVAQQIMTATSAVKRFRQTTNY
jgi:hypothetical protein